MAAGNNFWDFQQTLKGKNPTAAPAQEKPLTVTQLTARIEKALKTNLPASLHVQGEVSNYKLHTGSGHTYFTLKDATACIDCVMFRGEAMNLKFTPADGLELIATGRVAVHPQRGRYQFYVTALQPLGQGALELVRQQIQNKLEAEGLFNPDRKKPLPRYPRRIVLLTSAQTAAVQDMLKVLRRFPFLQVQVYHVPVQGDGSAEQIAAALQYLNMAQLTPGSERKATTRILPPIDLILLGRGGGSLEDMWEFNEEIVARAIAASRIPIVTGIGHEIDVSIADLAADYHAHTPTEAAQVATQHWRTAQTTLTAATLRLAREMQGAFQHARQRLLHIERHELFRRPLDRVNQFRQLIDDRQRSLDQATDHRLRLSRDKLLRLDARLRERHPRHLTALASQKITALAQRLHRATAQSVQSQSRRIDLLATRLHAINPAEVLKRGYSLTTHKKTGQIIKDPTQVKPGDTLLTRLANGQIESQVQDTRQLKLFD
jgi:exodeoxyribonuclease VII large subunit